MGCLLPAARNDGNVPLVLHLISQHSGKLIPYRLIVNAYVGDRHIRDRGVIGIHRNPHFQGLGIVILIIVRINGGYRQGIHLHFQQVLYHFFLYFFVGLRIRGQNDCLHVPLFGSLLHTCIDRHPVFAVPGFCHDPDNDLLLRFPHIPAGTAADA